ncbi:hypothetical protein PHMEG_00033508 [Phytophthora megakarya]|uniref:Uncharacterized protein n=1 Tax=Phytophthora megakarya TaxID=4795 RepID=A0A225UVM5_9STRA|nr:hypothetical protein PHMEG_00033508 [Phytophthora megakarya]
MAALFSAIAVSQTTKHFSIRLYRQISQRETGVQFWKWIAYAFFSKRASACSSFDKPIRFVRMFGDNGRSRWVHVLVPGLGHC